MSQVHNTVFISYRRDVASFHARAIFQALRERDFDVFMDVENIDSGQFGTIIMNQIAARAHFLIVLTPGTLERCTEPKDWLRLEIEQALRLNRNIVPLLINNFSLKTSKRYLPGALKTLPQFNGLNVPHDYFDEAIERLCTRFLKLPTEATVIPAPATDKNVVDQKLEELVLQPIPTSKDLSAEHYFISGWVKDDSGDLEGAIEDNTHAIQLKPDYANAYVNRGVAHFIQGDTDAAIEDYDRAIQIKPNLAAAYRGRGLALSDLGHLSAAIEDYNRAIQLEPDYDLAYRVRGVAYQLQGNLHAAIADYQKYLDLGGGRQHNNWEATEKLIRDLKAQL